MCLLSDLHFSLDLRTQISNSQISTWHLHLNVLIGIINLTHAEQLFFQLYKLSLLYPFHQVTESQSLVVIFDFLLFLTANIQLISIFHQPYLQNILWIWPLLMTFIASSLPKPLSSLWTTLAQSHLVFQPPLFSPSYLIPTPPQLVSI